jgi:hypothetical protein
MTSRTSAWGGEGGTLLFVSFVPFVVQTFFLLDRVIARGIHAFPKASRTWMAGTSQDKPGHDELKERAWGGEGGTLLFVSFVPFVVQTSSLLAPPTPLIATQARHAISAKSIRNKLKWIF